MIPSVWVVGMSGTVTEPLYWQIAQELRGQIESGALAPGDQLPSEMDLRSRYRASRNTIRDAVKWLAGRGLAIAYLRESIGLVQVGYRDRIVVRAPEEEESRFFGLPDDGRVPVVSVVRAGFAARQEGAEKPDGDAVPAPFRLTFTIMPADRNQLVVDSGEVPDRWSRGPAGAHSGPPASGA